MDGRSPVTVNDLLPHPGAEKLTPEASKSTLTLPTWYPKLAVLFAVERNGSNMT